MKEDSIMGNMYNRRLRWASHLARMEEGRSAFKIIAGKPTGKRPTELQQGISTRKFLPIMLFE